MKKGRFHFGSVLFAFALRRQSLLAVSGVLVVLVLALVLILLALLVGLVLIVLVLVLILLILVLVAVFHENTSKI